MTSSSASDFGFGSTPVGHLSLHLPDQHAADERFLFERKSKRLGGALGASLATHLAVFVALMIAASILPNSPIASLQPDLVKHPAPIQPGVGLGCNARPPRKTLRQRVEGHGPNPRRW